MGGSFDIRFIEGKTLDEIKKKWDSMVDQDLHENGHSYSGSIGMLGTNFDLREPGRTFKTNEEAEDWISEHQDKWERAVAVQVETKNKDMVRLAIGGWCSS